MAAQSQSPHATSASPLILVPLDGSTIAEEALPVAGTIAHRSGRQAHLVSVVHPVPFLVPSGDEPMPDYTLEAELRQQMAEYLRATAEALETTHGIEVDYDLLDGPPAQVLADHARSKRADLIVMTTHGHSGLNRLWLGSVSDGLMRRVKSPVLLLRPNDGAHQAEFRRVLIALDGLAEGEKILEPAIELGSLCPDSEFTLVQVVEPPVALITRMAMHPTKMRPHWRELEENRARSYLQRIAGSMRARGLHVASRMIASRGIADQILELADSLRTDLLVVGTHGAQGIERMLLGSVADKVVRGASMPVLVVPTRKESG